MLFYDEEYKSFVKDTKDLLLEIKNLPNDDRIKSILEQLANNQVIIASELAKNQGIYE